MLAIGPLLVHALDLLKQRYSQAGERQSSVAAQAGGDQDKVPDGVRLSLGMSAASGVAGTITLDWVRSTLSMNRQ